LHGKFTNLKLLWTHGRCPTRRCGCFYNSRSTL
jgi:hypothetical protein